MRHRPITQFVCCFPFSLSLRSHGLATLAAVVLLASAFASPQRASAFEAVVVQEKPAIRAGAGPSYYVVGQATNGQRIEVLRIVHGWYELEPTDAVSLYFEKSQLEAAADGKTAKTRRAGLTGYLASMEGPGASTWAGPPLEKGAELQIRGEEGGYYRVAPPKGTVVYLAPGAVRRMLPDEVIEAAAEVAARSEDAAAEAESTDEPQAATPEQPDVEASAEQVVAPPVVAPPAAAAEAVDEAVADIADEAEAASDDIEEAAEPVIEPQPTQAPAMITADSGRRDESAPAVRVTPRRQGPGAAAVERSATGSRVGIERASTSGIGVEGRPTQAPRTVEDDGVDLGLPETDAPNSVPVTAKAYVGDGPVAAEPMVEGDEPEAPVQPMVDPAADRADINAIDPQLRQLEARTLAMLEKPLEQQRLDGLISAFKAMEPREDLSRSDAWIVQARLAQLDRNKQLQKALAGLKQAQADAKPLPVATEPQPVEQAPQPRQKPVYTHTGLLVASGVYDGSKLPQLYRLVNPVTKRTIAYVKPSDLIAPKRVLGRRVGIVGRIAEDAQLGIGVIDPTVVDVIKP